MIEIFQMIHDHTPEFYPLILGFLFFVLPGLNLLGSR